MAKSTEGAIALRDRAGAPTSVPTSERIGVLEEEIRALKRQIHSLRIEYLLDLRVGLGLITQEERGESRKILSTIQNDGLEIMQTDLSNLFRSFMWRSPRQPTGRGTTPYVA